MTKELSEQKSRDSSCDPALSEHDNVNHHQDNTLDQHCEHLIGSQLVVMVLRAQLPLFTMRNFSILWRRKIKETTKKTKAFYDWATTGIPVIIQTG